MSKWPFLCHGIAIYIVNVVKYCRNIHSTLSTLSTLSTFSTWPYGQVENVESVESVESVEVDFQRSVERHDYDQSKIGAKNEKICWLMHINSQ